MTTVDTLTDPAIVEAAADMTADGAVAEEAADATGTQTPDLMGALGELQRAAEARTPAARRRFEDLLRREQLGEACQASWDGLHRAVADGGNAYLE